MSLSSRVVGIKKPDEKFFKMKAVYDACNHANIVIPDEVYNYFGDEEPSCNGVVVEIPDSIITEITNLSFEIDLEKLDKDIKILRFEIDN